MAVAILVVQVKDLIVDLVLSHSARSSEDLNIINPVPAVTYAARENCVNGLCIVMPSAAI